jgi:long-chain acyl-CoA synthetase
MRCYLGLDQETNAAIDAERWFHTGDIGKLDSNGYLYITDRIKDIIVLANGKKVAPQPIEAMLKESPLIAETVLLGDEQNSITALILPSFDTLTDWANKFHVNYKDLHELVTNSEVKRLYKQEIDMLSDCLADFERIKRFVLLETPFTIETGELTPTLKVKRKVIAEKYSELIKSM